MKNFIDLYKYETELGHFVWLLVNQTLKHLRICKDFLSMILHKYDRRSNLLHGFTNKTEDTNIVMPHPSTWTKYFLSRQKFLS